MDIDIEERRAFDEHTDAEEGKLVPPFSVVAGTENFTDFFISYKGNLVMNKTYQHEVVFTLFILFKSYF